MDQVIGKLRHRIWNCSTPSQLDHVRRAAGLAYNDRRGFGIVDSGKDRIGKCAQETAFIVGVGNVDVALAREGITGIVDEDYSVVGQEKVPAHEESVRIRCVYSGQWVPIVFDGDRRRVWYILKADEEHGKVREGPEVFGGRLAEAVRQTGANLE